MELVKTIDQLKAEKAAIFAQLVSLQAGSRRATLDEIAESVREKYDERHEGEGMENE
jgi:cell division protein FtsB